MSFRPVGTASTVPTAAADARLHTVLAAGNARAPTGVNFNNYTFVDEHDALSAAVDVSGRLRDFQNQDVFDTLNPSAIERLLNPPDTYSPIYTQLTNLTMLTALKTLLNRIDRLEGEVNRLKG